MVIFCFQMKAVLGEIAFSKQQLIEGMKISFTDLLFHHTRFFQEIMLNFSSDRIEFVIEMKIHVFAKTATIIVSIRSAVAKRFQDNVRLNENIADSTKKHSIRSFSLSRLGSFYRWISAWLETFVTAAMYRKIIFDASVFPDPDSPARRTIVDERTPVSSSISIYLIWRCNCSMIVVLTFDRPLRPAQRYGQVVRTFLGLCNFSRNQIHRLANLGTDSHWPRPTKRSTSSSSSYLTRMTHFADVRVDSSLFKPNFQILNKCRHWDFGEKDEIAHAHVGTFMFDRACCHLKGEKKEKDITIVVCAFVFLLMRI